MLGPAVPPGVETLAVEARGGILDVVGRIAEAAQGHDVVLVAGISLGAHAAVRWAATGGRPGALLLAMPAWTGEPGPVAGLTASSADEIEQRGRDAVLADISAAAPDDWVGEELRRGWSTFADDELVAALRSAAASPGPTLVELAAIGVPSAVVALRDDPLHPERVAHRWAGAIPGAQLVALGRQAPLADRGALGRAGGLALSRT
jgi:pimeloyl-ACP methyl ester carboxylesterase